MSTTFCSNCQKEHPGRVCDYKDGECAETRTEPLRHVYRTYENLGITVCQNCAKFKKDIESVAHHVFEHGYCADDCAGCAALVCVPLPLEHIKPIDTELRGWQKVYNNPNICPCHGMTNCQLRD